MTNQTDEWQKAQDQLKLIKYYDIPIIDGKNTRTEAIKTHKRHPKEKRKNPLLTFLKKCLYFKPKTFIGATVLAAVLTTLSGALMTSLFQKNESHRLRKHPKPAYVENNATNNFIYQKMMYLYTLYQFENNWLGQLDGRILVCQGCGDSVQGLKTKNGKDVQMSCISCQKPFEILLPQVIQNKELTR